MSSNVCQGFIPKLKDNILGRLLNSDYDGDSYGEFTDEERNSVRIAGERIYRCKTLRINYTTYDVRRDANTINPTTHPDIMVKSPETGSDAQPFWYARVIGIFHALGDSKSEFEIGHDLDEAEEPYNVDDEDGASDWESDAIDTISSSDSDSDGSNCASDGYANF